MQPTGPRLPSLLNTATLAKSSDVRSAWRVGQVLQGVVARDSSRGQTALQIGRQLIQAQTGNLKLSAGQPLRLEVVNLAKQVPVLRLLNTLRQDAVSQALRQILPNQRPLPQALSTLTAVAGSPQAAETSPRIAQLVRNVLARLPDPSSVSTPQGLRQSLQNSGGFLEHKLAQTAGSATPARTGTPPPNPTQATQGDFKAGLLRLAAQLQQAAQGAAAARPGAATGSMTGTARAMVPPNLAAPAAPSTASLPRPFTPAAVDVLASLRPGMPPRPQTPVNPRALRLDMLQLLQRGALLQQVESALARVKLNQLSSLPHDRQQQPEWLVELPVRRNDEAIDVWSLRIRRDAEQKRRKEEAAAQPNWTVMLAFDLPGLGPMQARVNLSGDNRLSTQFLSEQGDPLRKVTENLPRLRARLEQSGLQVEELNVKRGRLREPHDKGSPGPILDDKA